MPELTRWIRLGDLAHTRSGDKGDRSNIGVVANDAAGYAWLDIHLTEAAVAEFLRPMGIGRVKRYAIPGLHAFNFVIDHALAGGASRSLRLDTQGKALGTVLLELTIARSSASDRFARLWKVTTTHERLTLVIREDRGPVAILTLESPRAAQRPFAGAGGPS